MMLATQPAAGSIAWIEAALLIFVVVFVAVTIGVLLRKRGQFDDAARIPLEDDDPVTPRSTGGQGDET